jgi:hypothetical protein
MNTFNEITLTNGDVSVMVHIEGTKAVRLYAFRADVDDGYFAPSWQWKDGLNPLFVHLVSPSPVRAKRALHARGFIGADHD